MSRKQVKFGAQPKPQPDLNEWVENREVPVTEKATLTPEPEPTPLKPEEPKEKMKRLTLDIPESLHRRIKGKAVLEGVTMVEMLRELLEKTYESEKKMG